MGLLKKPNLNEKSGSLQNKIYFNDCIQKLVKEKKLQRLVILRLKNVSFIIVNFVRRCRYSYNTGV